MLINNRQIGRTDMYRFSAKIRIQIRICATSDVENPGNLAGTGSLPAGTGNLPVSTRDLPVSTGNLSVSTGNLPVGTGNLSVSTGNLEFLSCWYWRKCV
jgi:hypothetical protein